MYKNFIAAILLFAFAGLTKAQNFVLNGSFENTGACPIVSTDFPVFLNPWDSALGTVDYYHFRCGDPGSAATTNNTTPFDGNGFIGLNAYGTNGGTLMREYLYSELDSPLDSGKLYRVSFYIKPVIDNAQGIGYGINNIGIALTDSVFDSIPTTGHYAFEAQVKADRPITALNYWTPICGVFRATGKERYITIGNFRTDIQTAVLPLTNAVNPTRAYYLIDYLEVVPNDLPSLPNDTILCENKRIDIKLNAPNSSIVWDDETSGPKRIITEPGLYYATISNPSCSYVDSMLIEPAFCEDCKVYVPNAFTPNGDGLNDLFELETNCDLVKFRINIFDRWGRKVFESDNIDVSWDGSEVDQMGVFSYIVEYEFELLTETQVTIERGTILLLQ